MASLGGRLALRLLLAVVVLVPTGVLFSQARQASSRTDATASVERDGAAYLSGLSALCVALEQIDVDLAAGDAVEFGALGRAVDAVNALDARLGDGLRSHERWVDIRTKIQALPHTGDPAAVEAAYGPVQDLLLGLFTKVATTSKLILDPAADTYYLQAAAAVELPTTIVATSHLINRVMLVSRAQGASTASLVDAAASRENVLAASGRAMDDLTLAEEATGSTTLGTSLLGQVDKVQLALQSLAALTTTAALPAMIKPTSQTRLHQAGDDLATAASALATSAFGELDRLLAARITAENPRRRIALGALVAAILLVLAVAVLPPLVGRRSRAGMRGGTVPATAAEPAGPPNPATIASVPPWPSGAGVPDAGAPASRREWSGAAR